MARSEKAQDTSVSTDAQVLGTYLMNLRTARKFSLRDVQEASEVSNAYLSQLENGRIRKPSPWILKKLADLYAVSYESLMAKAGYLSEEQGRSRRSASVVAAGSDSVFGKLTSDEEAKLLEYLAFMRSREPKKHG